MHLAIDGLQHNSHMLRRLIHKQDSLCHAGYLGTAKKQSAPLGRRLPVRHVDRRMYKPRPKLKAHRLADASRFVVWIGAQPPTTTPPGQSRSSTASASLSWASSGPMRMPCSSALFASAKRSISMHALPCRQIPQTSIFKYVHGGQAPPQLSTPPTCLG